jgi:hypothetical protein
MKSRHLAGDRDDGVSPDLAAIAMQLRDAQPPPPPPAAHPPPHADHLANDLAWLDRLIEAERALLQEGTP